MSFMKLIQAVSWVFGPPVKHEKSGRAGVLARHSTGLMVRKTHPTKGFSEQGQREAGFSLDNYSNKRKHN